MYNCPVCGYKNLPDPPENFTICPSCDVEFGVEDSGYGDIHHIHRDLRQRWIVQMHAEWQSTVVPKPRGWNAWQQLIDADFGCDIPWLSGIVMTHTPIHASGFWDFSSHLVRSAAYQ